MNQTPPRPQAGPGGPSAEAQVPHHSIWERILADLHKRPGRYMNAVLGLIVLAMVVVFLLKYWHGRNNDAAAALATTWTEAWDNETGPKARASTIEGLSPQLTNDREQARRLYDLAITYRDIAEAADSQADKLSAYEKALAYCADLKSKYPNSLWGKLPVRPPATGGAASPAAIVQVEDYARHQVEWLKAHPFLGAVEPDPNLSVTFELEDGRKIVVGKLFGRVAPFHVQNFVELARSGYYDGTGFSRVSQGYKRGVMPKQGERPPNISVEGGHPFTKLTPDNREDDDSPVDIGYSVPDEANSLPVKRGSLVAASDFSSGGDSPSRFKLYADEPPGAQDTVFGEITEGLDVLDAIVTPASPEGHPMWTKDLVRIKKATVQGSVLKPPERPFPPAPILPDVPKPASKPAESQPASKPADSRPATNPSTGPGDDHNADSRPADSRPK